MAADQVQTGKDLVEHFKHIGINDKKIREYITQPSIGYERLNIIEYEFYSKFIFPITRNQTPLNGILKQELGEFFYNED